MSAGLNNVVVLFFPSSRLSDKNRRNSDRKANSTDDTEERTVFPQSLDKTLGGLSGDFNAQSLTNLFHLHFFLNQGETFLGAVSSPSFSRLT